MTETQKYLSTAAAPVRNRHTQKNSAQNTVQSFCLFESIILVYIIF